MATFGDTTAGASSFPYSSDRAIVRSFALTETALLTSITVFFDGSSTSAEDFKGLIYADSSGSPGSRLAISSVGTLPIGGTSLTMSISGTLSPGTYWLGCVAAGFTGRWAADAGVGGQRQEAVTYASPAATFGTPAGSTADGISVYATYTAAPTISVQPTDQTANNGATATFTVTDVGGTSYQWQDNSSGSFADIGGATSSSYTTGAASYSMQGRQYRCVVTNAAGSVTSNAAALRVAYNLTGTGIRSFPNLGHPFGAGTVDSYLRGSSAASGTHSTSGALSAQSATIASSATHLTLHTTTGALSAQAATISGAAQHQHVATGALAAQAATVAGSAAHLTLHTTTGALSAQSATIAGSAAHQHAATGALQAQSATIAGAADHTAAGASHSTSGALNADAATIAGSATHLTLHTTTGALSAQSATISGAALHPHTTSGALQAQSATLAGTAAHATLHTTSGALAAQAATLSGAAAHEHASTGVLAAQAATISGSAAHTAAGVRNAIGALASQEATIAGDALRIPGGIQPIHGPGGYRKKDRDTASALKSGWGATAQDRAPAEVVAPEATNEAPKAIANEAQDKPRTEPTALALAMEAARERQALQAAALDIQLEAQRIAQQQAEQAAQEKRKARANAMAVLIAELL